MNISCIFGMHKFEYAQHRNPFQMKTLSPIAIHIDGRISGGKLVSFGFLHYGIISKCTKCGKEVDAEEMNLPIIMPDFSET